MSTYFLLTQSWHSYKRCPEAKSKGPTIDETIFRQLLLLLLPVLFLSDRSAWSALKSKKQFPKRSKPWADLQPHGFFIFKVSLLKLRPDKPASGSLSLQLGENQKELITKTRN